MCKVIIMCVDEVNKMPVTNKNDWREADWNHLGNVSSYAKNIFEFFGIFYVGNDKVTLHGSSLNGGDEGIRIRWEDNYFNLEIDKEIKFYTPNG